MARYRKQRNIGECGRDSQDDQNMIVNDEIRVTNVEGIARSNKESALAFFVIRHSCFLISIVLRQTRSDRNKSEYLCALLHRPPLESGENAPFLRPYLDAVKSSLGSTVQSLPENAAHRLSAPILELRHPHPVC